jgi:ABC-type lipoprotein release transport system permease subunit
MKPYVLDYGRASFIDWLLWASIAFVAVLFIIAGAFAHYGFQTREVKTSLDTCLHASTASSEGEEYERVRLACESKISMRGSP